MLSWLSRLKNDENKKYIIMFYKIIISIKMGSPVLLRKLKWADILNAKPFWGNKRYRVLCDTVFRQDAKLLSKKKSISICFVVYADTTWSFDLLCDLLKADNRFDLRIVAARDFFEDLDYSKVKKYLKGKGFPVYEANESGWSDSDIFVYQNPYPLKEHECDIDNRTLDKLSIIVPYAIFQGDSMDEHLENDHHIFSACVWRYYCYTRESFIYGKNNNIIGDINMRLSGYPKMDVMYSEVINMPRWPGDETSKKHVLFAPSMIWKYSAFMDVWTIMLEIAKEMQNISWIFRPHPMLGKTMLRNHLIDRIDIYEEYLKKWEMLPNATVQIGGDYSDTFKTSDAIIADGTSFLTNYQYIGKPFLYLRGGRNEELSTYGEKLYECLYISDGDYERDIRRFLDDVVLGQNDTLKDNREVFFEESLNYLRFNGCLASEYIYRDLTSSIFK